MKKIFTLLLSFIAVSFAMAQNEEGVFKKASTAPVIDGTVDAVWAESNVYNIDKAVGTQTPSIGESTWKGVWTDAGIYILLDINDNEFAPNYLAPGYVAGTSGFEDYNWDKFELYFDVNYNLTDGGGPSDDKGHYQVAPGFALGKTDGTPTTGTDGVIHAFKVEGSHTIAEYFVPFSKLKDSQDAALDKTSTIGFDVTIIDRDLNDAARNQAVWSNTGVPGESWTNMDGAGHVTFEGGEANITIDNITLNNGGTITTNNGTLQMVATITPENATIKELKWTVINGTGRASIDQNGLLTAINDGTVSVVATATDGTGIDATVDVEITGQILSRNDIWNSYNLIKNWSFEDLDATTVSGLAYWGGWLDGAGQIKAVQEEGVAVMTTAIGANNEQYHYQFSQGGLQALPDVPYVVTFKSWADAERSNTLDFEDTEANKYNRYGASTDAEAQGGRSEWHYTLTTEPQWFTFHVTFDQIIETTNQKMQWLQSQAAGTVYLDSVLLITQEEYDLLQTLPKTSTGVSVKATSIKNVYPSPVTNTLFVELTAINSKVAIYNAIGQKLMEKTATSNKVSFDVSSLRSGLYFVRLEDGTTKKFVK